MEFELKYSEMVLAQGCNGLMECSGMNVFETSSGTFRIEPLTSRGAIGNCWIDIPKDDIEKLIRKLKKAIKEG